MVRQGITLADLCEATPPKGDRQQKFVDEQTEFVREKSSLYATASSCLRLASVVCTSRDCFFCCLSDAIS